MKRACGGAGSCAPAGARNQFLETNLRYFDVTAFLYDSHSRFPFTIRSHPNRNSTAFSLDTRCFRSTETVPDTFSLLSGFPSELPDFHLQPFFKFRFFPTSCDCPRFPSGIFLCTPPNDQPGYGNHYPYHRKVNCQDDGDIGDETNCQEPKKSRQSYHGKNTVNPETPPFGGSFKHDRVQRLRRVHFLFAELAGKDCVRR